MSPPPSLPTQRRSSVARRMLVALGVYALAIAVLVTAFYLEENWRGARAWAACQRELQAKGESLDWKTFIPPPVPDEQNLAMAPLFVRALHYQPDPKTHVYTFGSGSNLPVDLKDMPFGNLNPSSLSAAGWNLAKRTDLAGYQRSYRQQSTFPHTDQPQSPPADMLLALSRYDSALAELSQSAAERPLTRFPVDWLREDTFAISLSHYNLEQQFVTTLRLRASAQLASNHPKEALRDLELGFRLCRDMRGDPTLIAHLVQITCLNTALNAIWEGLADRRWSAAEINRVQGDLRQFDLVAGYLTAMRSERAFSIHGLDYYRNGRGAGLFQSIMSIQGPSSNSVNPFARLASAAIPGGWYDLNKVTIARFEQDYAVGAADPNARRFFPNKPAGGERALGALRLRPANFFAKIMLPVMESMSRRTALVQTGLDEAVVACALERFFLERHAYPARLDEMVPAYLERVPNDVIDGAPLRYRLTPDGRYQLYGVGWNARDEAGKVVWQTARKLKDNEGDWVWQYMALEPPPLGATE